MDNNIKNGNHYCHKCSRIVPEEEVVFYGVRSGYSAAHFPLFHFEKVPLCSDCLVRQKKTELLEKGLAIIALAIVLYFMAIGFAVMFG